MSNNTAALPFREMNFVMCLRSRQLITWRPDGTRARMVIVFYKHIVPTGRKRMGSTSRPNRVETRHTQLVFLSQRDNMFVANVPALRPPPRMGGMLTGTVVNYECHPEPYVSNNTAALPFREMSFVTCPPFAPAVNMASR